jgi:hypothetical protein
VRGAVVTFAAAGPTAGQPPRPTFDPLAASGNACGLAGFWRTGCPYNPRPGRFAASREAPSRQDSLGHATFGRRAT